MLEIKIDVRQIARGAEAFRKMPERLQQRLLDAMMASEFAVLKQIGDRTPVRTGNLRRSETADLPPKPQPDGKLGWLGRVLIGAEYGRAVEFGKTKREKVRAHVRSEAWGRPTQPFTVRAHMRTPNQPAHPFVRPGLAAAEPTVRDRHVDAVRKTIQDMSDSVNG